ncbi:MFS transporter, partial [Serratia quinivorans]
AELSGGAVMLAEYAPAKRRGLVASIIAIGSNSGTPLASLVWLLVLQLDKAELIAWGWRIPFLASILIAGGALYLRRHVRETPVFERELQPNRQRMLDNAPVAADNRSYLQRTKAFWILLGLRIGENGPSYLCQGFIVGYVAKELMVDKSVPALAVVIASLCGFLEIPLAGLLSFPLGPR